MNEEITIAIEGSAPRTRIVATCSVIGAILASSCCIVPLVLITLGVSGAWIGNLTALEPYKPWFATITIGFLGSGFWQVYRKQEVECEEGPYCANPASNRLVKTAYGLRPCWWGWHSPLIIGHRFFTRSKR